MKTDYTIMIFWIPMAATAIVFWAVTLLIFREGWKSAFAAGFVGLFFGAIIGGTIFAVKRDEHVKEMRRAHYKELYAIEYVEFGDSSKVTFRKNNFLCEATEGFDDLRREIILGDTVQCSEEGDEREILENPR